MPQEDADCRNSTGILMQVNADLNPLP